MKLNSHNKYNKIGFSGSTSAVEKLSTVAKYRVQKSSSAFLDKSNLWANIASSGTYVFAGSSLIYEFIKRNPFKKAPKAKLNPVYKNSYKTQLEKTIFSKFTQKNQVSFGTSGGVKTIEPKTNFGKTGVKVARFAAVAAGMAGILNGIALGIPLLALGEGVTIASAPVIEKPKGIALFGIGLATINLSRVLEGDARYVIDRVKFNHLDTKGKINYIGQNLKDTSIALVKSTKELGQNFIKLFGKNKNEASKFFKTNFLSTKPGSVILQEFINKDGKLLVKRASLANPYLMHFATIVLGAASTMLFVANSLKMPKTEKVGLRGFNIGNSFDNLAVSKWGKETIELNKTNPLLMNQGRSFLVGGASLLASQFGLDKDWGRGLNWIGIGLLMGGFGFLRKNKLNEIAANKEVREEVTSLARQWKFDLNEMIGSKILREKTSILNNQGKKKTVFDAIKDMHKPEEFENEKAKAFMEKMHEFHEFLVKNNSGKFSTDKKSVEDGINDIFKDYIGKNDKTKNISSFGVDADFEKTKELVNKETNRVFPKKAEFVKNETFY